jgi:hypothetical protein
MSLEQKITNLLKLDEKELKTTLCLLLVAVTAAVYCQVAFHQFLNYDDQLFVYQNPHVYTGINWANVKWAFTTLHGDASYWHPLTWLSLQLDCQLFGLRPGALHLTNLLFHLANSVLLFIVLDKLTGKMWRSLLVASLFALHPLHVETVAWMSERKSLTCTFFWLLTTWTYCGYARRSGILRYLLVFVLCAASLMSKPLAVTLPFTLLLLDFWPLGRLMLSQPSTAESNGSPTPHFARLNVGNFVCLFVEKLPLFAFAGVVSWLTVSAQQELGAIISLADEPFAMRVQNAIVSYILYVRKMIWPVDLAVIYPLRTNLAWWETAGCGLVLFCFSIWAVQWLRERPYILFGGLWYLGTLFPVIGLAQAGSQGMADRYTYVPSIGIFLVIIWFVVDRLERKPKAGLVTLMVSVLCLLALISAADLWVWKNSVRLFEQATRATDGSSYALSNLGMAFRGCGNLPEAEYNLYEAMRAKPDLYLNQSRYAESLFERGDVEGAFEHFQRALELKPNDPETHAAFANLFENSSELKFHDPAKAVEHARRACELTHYGQRKFLVFLAGTYAKNDQFPEARKTVEDAQKMSITSKEVQEISDLLVKIQGVERQKFPK